MSMIALDGSFGEGGGALLRTALAFSIFTQKPFRIDNIRANRKVPGLKAQHLEAIKALKQICPGAKSSEVKLGETSMWFQPEKIKSGNFEFDIKTAGSITLFFQAILLPSLFAPSKVTITVKGGTCGKWQAGVDSLQRVLLPLIQRFTKDIKLTIKKRGYYPKGGGEVMLEISPLFKSKAHSSYQELIKEIESKTRYYNFINQGKLEHIKGFVNISADLQERQVGERLIKAARQTLLRAKVPISIDLGYFPALSTGGEILIHSVHSQNGFTDPFNSPRLLADSLLEKNKRAEIIGEETSNQLLSLIESKAAIDPLLCDQLIPFAALLTNSKINTSDVTNHTTTNLHVIAQFLNIKTNIANNTIHILANK